MLRLLPHIENSSNPQSLPVIIRIARHRENSAKFITFSFMKKGKRIKMSAFVVFTISVYKGKSVRPSQTQREEGRREEDK